MKRIMPDPRMRIHLVLVLLVITFIISTCAVPVALAASFSMDYCRYKSDDGDIYLELYIDLPRSAVVHKSQGNEWYGALLFSSQIRQSDLTIAADSWVIEDTVHSPESITNSQRLVDTRIYKLAPAEYNFRISVRDSISGTLWEINPVINVPEFPEDTLSSSDIELATHMIPPDLNSKFNRGDFGLIPNPRKIFGEARSYMYYYVELYPAKGIQDEVKYTINRSILNGIKDTVATLPLVLRNGTSNAFADIDSIYLGNLSTGTYDLVLDISASNGHKINKRTRFYIHNTHVPTEQFKPEIIPADIEEELDEITFLLKKGQRKAIEKMTMDEKQTFLNNFWNLYDDDPSTAEIPLRSEFRSRVAEADDLWRTYRNPGHKTDQGRIHVLYGVYDNIERFPMQSNTKPYEIWTYDKLDGGSIFVFVDRSGLGEYELVHSTRRGEVYNPSWYDLYVERSSVDTKR